MIELYKIFSGKYDSEMTEWITGKCIKRQYYNMTQEIIDFQIAAVTYSLRYT